MTYDVGIDQARHDEFSGFRAEIEECILAGFQAMLGDSVVEGVRVNVVLDPDDVAIGPDGDQAPRECEVMRQCLRIDNGTVEEIDHDVEQC